MRYDARGLVKAESFEFAVAMWFPAYVRYHWLAAYSPDIIQLLSHHHA